MKKYSDVEEFIDNYKKKIADDFDNIEDYYLILRIGQMYRELEQIKLSYEKLLNTEKGDMVKVMSQVRQNLYNARSGYPRKQELIYGINNAIKDLNKILIVREEENDNKICFKKW